MRYIAPTLYAIVCIAGIVGSLIAFRTSAQEVKPVMLDTPQASLTLYQTECAKEVLDVMPPSIAQDKREQFRGAVYFDKDAKKTMKACWYYFVDKGVIYVHYEDNDISVLDVNVFKPEGGQML